MEAADRQAVKQAVDKEQRARRQARIHSLELSVCNRCGCDLDTYTRGCTRCWARRRRTAKA